MFDAFANHASEILGAAESARASGFASSEMTILIGQDGAIHMVSRSDWPLESLAAHHGAKEAFRVSHQGGVVRVEGRAGARTCLMQSVPAAETARRLLGSIRT